MSTKHFDVKEHVIPAQHIRGYFKSTANSEEEELRLAVKQYSPKDNREPQDGDVTFIAAHAAGFCKELYEPLFDDLHQQSQGSFRIRSIWIADISTHGQSGVLNEGRLGIDLTWEDHARDLMQMTNIFRKEMPKPIVGLGHSMGANNIIQLALYHPRLLDAVICVEPVLNRDHKGMNFSPSYWLTERRDLWPSKEIAVAENRKSGLVKTWDPRVADRWDEFGFRELPTLLHPNADREGSRPVTFSTTKHHDVRAFVRDCHPPAGEPLEHFQPTRLSHPEIDKDQHSRHQQPAYRGDAVKLFRQIPFLRPPCLYIYGKRSTLFGSKPAGRAEKLEITGIEVGGSGGAKIGKVAEAVLDGAGHFAALEKPAKVAETASNWLSSQLQTWREEMATEAGDWHSLDSRQKAMVSDDWRWWVKEWYARKKPDDRRKPTEKESSGARL
ncbi:hypothetical protein PRZ48_010317 [Zasmidium cellare]|uniref:AB hydrolase-1 domain-containing protein n=1 Tax=Zasmidium cellare TaxID=395010 RepID=A0ABR0E8B0_ZASCE|nr:hypothetical protein PRZ48_010317 [Zasmidium cellare]